jgi:hypothetical protein
MGQGNISKCVKIIRTKADELRDFRADQQVAAMEWCVGVLELESVEADDSILTLNEAARISGYSTAHLARLIRDGTIPNAGKARRPRVRCGDLPRKPGSIAKEVQSPYRRRSGSLTIGEVVRSALGAEDG